jgi:hypothetical protein
MPFGKYRGYPVDSLPLDYARWLIANIELREPLRRHVLERVMQSDDQPRGATATTPGVNFGALRRKFAAKYHPDRPAGSTVAMTVVNDVFDQLDEQTKNSHRG